MPDLITGPTHQAHENLEPQLQVTPSMVRAYDVPRDLDGHVTDSLYAVRHHLGWDIEQYHAARIALFRLNNATLPPLFDLSIGSSWPTNPLEPLQLRLRWRTPSWGDTTNSTVEAARLSYHRRVEAWDDVVPTELPIRQWASVRTLLWHSLGDRQPGRYVRNELRSCLISLTRTWLDANTYMEDPND